MSNKVSSLQETTLNVIVNEFTKFTAAYYATRNRDLKRNFHFLQRAYSQSILTELERTGKLEVGHLEFLLNEHLKKVNVGLLLNFISLNAVVDKMKCIGSSVIELSFIQGEFSCVNTIQPVLPHVCNVTKVSIPNICTDEILKSLAVSCPQLTELDIHESLDITSTGLKSLCIETDDIIQAQCPLKIIDLSVIFDIDEGIAFILKYIPTLEVINCITLPDVLYSIYKSDNDIGSKITKRYNLTNIDFSHCEGEFLMDSLKLCSKLCPYLKWMKLNISNPAELEICTLFTELESLILQYIEIPPVIDINNFLVIKGSKLRMLNVIDVKLSVSTLIQNCPNLESLSLSRIEFQQPDKKAVKPLKRLNVLQLEWFKFTEKCCAVSIELLLNSSPELELLSVRSCEFNEPEVSAKIFAFSCNCNLKHLTFNNTDMDTDLLQQVIINCCSLQVLTLEYCDNLSEDDVEMLRQTIATSHKKIEILWSDDRSDFSYYSDYDFDDYDNDAFDFDNDYTDYDYGDYWDSDDYANYYDENDDYS